MPSKRLEYVLSTGLAYAALTLANLPVLVAVMWLIPGVVILEAALWLILALIAVGLMRSGRLLSQFAAGLRGNWFLLPFLVFSALSILWSVAWQVSLSRWLVLLATIVVAGLIGLRFDMSGIVRVLSIFIIAVLLLSTLVVVFVPRVGVMNYHIIQGAWKGIFWHKNHMGLIGAFATVLFLLNAIRYVQHRSKSAWWWGLAYVLSLLFVAQADSAASYLTLAALHGLIALAIAHLKFKDRLTRYHYAIVLAVLVLAVIAVLVNADLILRLVNRNATLTGRVPMWTYLFKTYLSPRPLAGYGFNAFWYIESHRVTMQHATGYPDQIVIADNGFIDILMNTGILGLAAFVLLYLGLWWRSMLRAWRARDVIDLFPLVLMAYTLLANTTWSLMFENESLFLLIMISIMFSIYQHEPAPLPVVAQRLPNTAAPSFL